MIILTGITVMRDDIISCRATTAARNSMPVPINRLFRPPFRAAATIALFAALCCGGCAAFLPGVLGDVSTLISLGSLGQTAIKVTYAAMEGKKMAVGWMPAQYAESEPRMLAEAWEQNFQLVKKVYWENEDVPWNELTATVLRKAGTKPAVFALVTKIPLGDAPVREEVAVFIAPSGKIAGDPQELPGQSFRVEMRKNPATAAVYGYSAFYFSWSRQPSGILAAEGPWDGPCRSAYTYGTLVAAVAKNSPAQQAGLRRGEVIMAVNSQPAEYRTIFSLFRFGDNAVAVCRDGTVSQKNLYLPPPAGSDSR